MGFGESELNVKEPHPLKENPIMVIRPPALGAKRVALMSPAELEVAINSGELRHLLLYYDAIWTQEEIRWKGCLNKAELETLERYNAIGFFITQQGEPDNATEMYDPRQCDELILPTGRVLNFAQFSAEMTVPSLLSTIERYVPEETVVTPVYNSEVTLKQDFSSRGEGTSSCLRIIVNQLPVPTESVPLEEVMQFRAEEETIIKRTALLKWQNEIERQNLKPHEIADLLAYLMNEYMNYMKIQKFKFRMGFAQHIVSIVPALLEALLRLRPSKTIDDMFSLGSMAISLREAELKAPGKEVAYIPHARDKF